MSRRQDASGSGQGQYYGEDTARSLNNYEISSLTWHPQLIKAIARIKLACAYANEHLRLLDSERTSAIGEACNEIIGGGLANQFPLDIFQSGSGTSTHMNVNEVIANRANEHLDGDEKSRIHPLHHVSMGQSTNNVIPSAIRIAALVYVNDLTVSLGRLQQALEDKSREFSDVLKCGRTHLQEPVPITLGQEFHAYATAIRKHIRRLEEQKSMLTVFDIGGNAVGTGVNTHPHYRGLIIKYLNEQGPWKFMQAVDGVESTQFQTDFAVLHSILKNLAADLHKIAGDLRLLSSGPRAGFAEISLPAMETSSGIIPGKNNPSLSEALTMVCFKVMGNDSTITHCASSGVLELNTTLPLMGHTLLESLEILHNAVDAFTLRCVSGIKANREQCRAFLEQSMGSAAALTSKLGYDVVANLVQDAVSTGKTLSQVIIGRGLMTPQALDALLTPHMLSKPNIGS